MFGPNLLKKSASILKKKMRAVPSNSESLNLFRRRVSSETEFHNI